MIHMDDDIKLYAETLYEGALQESSKTCRVDLRNAAEARSAAASTLPFSGFDLQHRIEILNRHIGRCVVARLESFQRAYEESGRIPSDQELDSILEECRGVRTLQIKHASKTLYSVVGSRGAQGPLPTSDYLEGLSAHAMDDVLSRWKQWKAKLRLKPAPAGPVERERQKDVLLPVLSRAEFNADLAALSSTATASSPLSLIFMDLDKFKLINDGAGGHAAGDRALKTFAEAVLRGSNSKGTAYRYGGDELCVLLANHSVDEAGVVAERIRREVNEIRTDELTNGLSTSVGVACLPESTDDCDQLCPLADAAMYDSKKAGGNRVTKSGARSVLPDSVVPGNRKRSKEEIMKDLSAFMKEGKVIQNGIAYNNQGALREKAVWEKRVEECLLGKSRRVVRSSVSDSKSPGN